MRKVALRRLVAFVMATVIWLPLLHVFFARDQKVAFAGRGVPDQARALAARQLDVFVTDTPSAEIAKEHGASGEWDFMGRTYVAWSLANMALREPEAKQKHLDAIDRIIKDTLALESEHGFRYFLLGYGQTAPFVVSPPRSVFVDGEIALMLALRRLVEESDSAKKELDARVQIITERMTQGPVVSAESYPDECWTFCNAVALAALTIADALDQTDHGALARKWIETAKAKLTDQKTGLLVSRYRYDGTVMEGPEGSTLWMVLHALAIVDPAYARSQYEAGKKALAHTILGFGYAREWPELAPGRPDIDSGPIIPILEISAGSSGLALVASKTFGDDRWFTELVTTLDFAGFPIEAKGRLRYSAGNQVGDAVLLYATVLGPAWDAVLARRKP